jgi:hypothetical protein
MLFPAKITSATVRQLARQPIPQIFAGSRRVVFSSRTQELVGEIFAYGGSMTIFSRLAPEHSEKNLGAVPPETRTYFNRVVVHPRLLD